MVEQLPLGLEQRLQPVDPNWVPAVADIILDIERRLRKNKEGRSRYSVCKRGVSLPARRAPAPQARAKSVPAASCKSQRPSSRPRFSLAVCSCCGAQDAVLRCSRCHRARFCSPACQRVSWPFHRETCASRLGPTVSRTERRKSCSSTALYQSEAGTQPDTKQPCVEGPAARYDIAIADTDDEEESFFPKNI
mmetsp:Transcript_113915/g.207232  ORF Transcript_113915/g.207232 Transcript_113915/m.207232 type:complete len:192 (+) Transcript_113915:94-669(+)